MGVMRLAAPGTSSSEANAFRMCVTSNPSSTSWGHNDGIEPGAPGMTFFSRPVPHPRTISPHVHVGYPSRNCLSTWEFKDKLLILNILYLSSMRKH